MRLENPKNIFKIIKFKKNKNEWPEFKQRYNQLCIGWQALPPKTVQQKKDTRGSFQKQRRVSFTR